MLVLSATEFCNFDHGGFISVHNIHSAYSRQKFGKAVGRDSKAQIPLDLFCWRPGLQPGRRLFLEPCRSPVTDLSATCLKPAVQLTF